MISITHGKIMLFAVLVLISTVFLTTGQKDIALGGFLATTLCFALAIYWPAKKKPFGIDVMIKDLSDPNCGHIQILPSDWPHIFVESYFKDLIIGPIVGTVSIGNKNSHVCLSVVYDYLTEQHVVTDGRQISLSFDFLVQVAAAKDEGIFEGRQISISPDFLKEFSEMSNQERASRDGISFAANLSLIKHFDSKQLTSYEAMVAAIEKNYPQIKITTKA